MSGPEGTKVGVWTLKKHTEWADYYECDRGHTFRYGKGDGGAIPATCAQCDGSVLADVDERYYPFPSKHRDPPPGARTHYFSFDYQVLVDGVEVASGVTSAQTAEAAEQQARDNVLETLEVRLRLRIPEGDSGGPA